jgi:hypothetical protein
MFFIDWDFGRYNLSILLEGLFKTIWLYWLWNFSYEQIMFN